MAKNSRAKGKNGELEFCHFLRDQFGLQARRGQQFQGSPDSPDVVSDLAGIHFEVKRVEAFRIYEAVNQAVADCGSDVPVVAYRKSRGDWLCILRFEDMLEFSRRVTERLGATGNGA